MVEINASHNLHYRSKCIHGQGHGALEFTGLSARASTAPVRMRVGPASLRQRLTGWTISKKAFTVIRIKLMKVDSEFRDYGSKSRNLPLARSIRPMFYYRENTDRFGNGSRATTRNSKTTGFLRLQKLQGRLRSGVGYRRLRNLVVF